MAPKSEAEKKLDAIKAIVEGDVHRTRAKREAWQAIRVVLGLDEPESITAGTTPEPAAVEPADDAGSDEPAAASAAETPKSGRW